MKKDWKKLKNERSNDEKIHRLKWFLLFVLSNLLTAIAFHPGEATSPKTKKVPITFQVDQTFFKLHENQKAELYAQSQLLCLSHVDKIDSDHNNYHHVTVLLSEDCIAKLNDENIKDIKLYPPGFSHQALTKGHHYEWIW